MREEYAALDAAIGEVARGKGQKKEKERGEGKGGRHTVGDLLLLVLFSLR